MADVILKSMTFPNLPDRYVIPSTTIEDGSITEEKLSAELQASIANKADKDGYYQQMTVGNAEQLVATVGIEDKVPYTFRTSGGSADIGDREVDKLIGGTVVWNQLFSIDSQDRTDTKNDITLTDNRDGTYKINGTAMANASFTLKANSPTPVGHVLILWGYKAIGNSFMGYAGYIIDRGNGGIWKNTSSYTQLGVRVDIIAGDVFDNVTIRPQYCDLTQMFGSTIADYIYSLETATAGAGVAYFRKLFPKPYYAYNAGELMSVQTSGHKMVGFNQFNPTNYAIGSKSNYNENEGAQIGVGGTEATVTGSDPFAITNTTNWRGAVFYSEPLVAGAAYYLSYYMTGTTKADIKRTLYLVDDDNYIVSKLYSWNGTTAADDYLHNYTFTALANTKMALVVESSSAQTIRLSKFCVHLVWDGERDGEYEPYEEHVYPLDDVVLRGIPKLDANNNLYYDGDEYADDGTVTRKYGIVDLGSLTWAIITQGNNVFSASHTVKSDTGSGNTAKLICEKYTTYKSQGVTYWASETNDKVISLGYDSARIYIRDTSYSDATAFKTAMDGVMLVYELTTPTTETADPFTNPQIVDDWGTEEYIDERTIPIPVGHDTMYRANLRAKLEMLPNSPDSDGDYVVRHSNGENEYVVLEKELPTAPTTDGTYHLKLTVSGTTKTLVWEADS